MGDNNLSVCPGETRGPKTCDRDDTHRVCLSVRDTPFFEATGQTDWCGEEGRCPSLAEPAWCVCKWALARYVQEVGCDAVKLKCDATDVRHLLEGPDTDAGTPLAGAKACVRQQCGDA
jgi:hypothetical protein